MARWFARPLLFALLAGAVAACGAIPRPDRFDPLRGIVPVNAPPQAAATTIPDAGGKRLGVLISDSSEKQLDWLKQVQAKQENNPLFSDLSRYWDSKLIAGRI